MEKTTHIIDAEGKILGRLAVQISTLLRGKNKLNWAPNKDLGEIVIVKNIDKIKFTGKKIEQKKYYHYSGYPGGLKETSLKKLLKENPTEILRRAVYGMLPKNKLRARQIKRLKLNS